MSGGLGNSRWTPPRPPVAMTSMPSGPHGRERAADRRRAERALHAAGGEVAGADLARRRARLAEAPQLGVAQPDDERRRRGCRPSRGSRRRRARRPRTPRRRRALALRGSRGRRASSRGRRPAAPRASASATSARDAQRARSRQGPDPRDAARGRRLAALRGGGEVALEQEARGERVARAGRVDDAVDRDAPGARRARRPARRCSRARRA